MRFRRDGGVAGGRVMALEQGRQDHQRQRVGVLVAVQDRADIVERRRDPFRPQLRRRDENGGAAGSLSVRRTAAACAIAAP